MTDSSQESPWCLPDTSQGTGTILRPSQSEFRYMRLTGGLHLRAWVALGVCAKLSGVTKGELPLLASRASK